MVTKLVKWRVNNFPASTKKKYVNNNETENVPNLLDDHTRV